MGLGLRQAVMWGISNRLIIAGPNQESVRAEVPRHNHNQGHLVLEGSFPSIPLTQPGASCLLLISKPECLSTSAFLTNLPPPFLPQPQENSQLQALLPGPPPSLSLVCTGPHLEEEMLLTLQTTTPDSGLGEKRRTLQARLRGPRRGLRDVGFP